MIRVLIRDDDTCAFTEPEELEKVYSKYWAIKIPINLSITPFRIPGGFGDFNPNMHWGIPKHLWGSFKPLILEDNHILVQWIKEKLEQKLIDVALHGYNHLTLPNEYNFSEEEIKIPQIIGREYFYGKNLYYKTKEGKKYLENLLGLNLKAFIPPGNAISKEGLKAIIKNKLNLVGVPSLWKINKRPINFNNLKNLTKRILWYLKKKETYYPFILDFGDHKEIQFITLGPDSNLERIDELIDFCNDVDGYFVLATHYHAFDVKLNNYNISIGEAFSHIMKKIFSYNCTFLTYNEIF